MEDGQEALGHQVVDLQLVLAHAPEVVLGAGGDDRVMVGDLLVVDHAAQRQLVQREHVLRAAPVLRVVAHEADDRLDLGDHVAGQKARVGARIGQRLVLFVESLRRAQRAARGESIERVGVALETREVVEQLRTLALLLLLQLGDLARLPRARVDDRLGVLCGRQPLSAQIPAAVLARARGLEARLDQPVGLGLEVAYLLLAPGDQRERGGLDAAERDGAVESSAQADAGGAGGVHAHHPVGLRA